MKLDSLFNRPKRLFALEVFPPKRHSGVESVYFMLEQLGDVPTDYISVTYSAGGSGAKEYTAQIAERLKSKHKIEPLAHLTCLYSAKNDICKELQNLKAAGVENILALRGDPIENVPPLQDFCHASDLMSAIADTGDYYIVGACYPEGHPESGNLSDDIDNMRRKQDAGTGHFVSQLFFDNAKYLSFINLARQKGMTLPVEAGVMPVVRVEQIQRTVSLSSASLPSGFTRWINRWADSPRDFFEAGLEYSITQIRGLLENGVDGIHLYAMNNPIVAARVYQGIADLL